MMLVDTSVWIDHFRSGNDALATLLYHAEVLSHPFIVGELACGNLRQRDEILPWLAALPAVRSADHDEVLAMIATHRLMGSGIGWIDAHLLASAMFTDTVLWILDLPLARAARSIGVYAQP